MTANYSLRIQENQDSARTVIAVDYAEVDGLTRVLVENEVEVITSANFIYDDSSTLTETNLIKAAERSRTTKRFVISNWGVPIPPEEYVSDPSNTSRIGLMGWQTPHPATASSSRSHGRD